MLKFLLKQQWLNFTEGWAVMEGELKYYADDNEYSVDLLGKLTSEIREDGIDIDEVIHTVGHDDNDSWGHFLFNTVLIQSICQSHRRQSPRQLSSSCLAVNLHQGKFTSCCICLEAVLKSPMSDFSSIQFPLFLVQDPHLQPTHCLCSDGTEERSNFEEGTHEVGGLQGM